MCVLLLDTFKAANELNLLSVAGRKFGSVWPVSF